MREKINDKMNKMVFANDVMNKKRQVNKNMLPLLLLNVRLNKISYNYLNYSIKRQNKKMDKKMKFRE